MFLNDGTLDVKKFFFHLLPKLYFSFNLWFGTLVWVTDIQAISLFCR